MRRAPFIGRERELGQLREALDAASGGEARVALLAGEPGIGKTRTVEELERFAGERAARVLWGRSREASGAPPYWPWVQATRALGVFDELSSLAGADAIDLQRILPELRDLRPDLPAAMEAVDAEWARFRLFQAVAALYRRAAEHHPLVLVLDDLHWADRSALLLLGHVAAELRDARLLIVGTYRDSEVTRAHPLDAVLADLGGVPGFERIVLTGLSREETAEYVRGASGSNPTDAVLHRIFETTEGNPFFLNGLVELLARTGELEQRDLARVALPEGVSEAVRRQLDRLPPETERLLTLAAVVGRAFTLETLTALQEHAEEEQVLERLEEALAVRMIEDGPRPGGYRFVHALVQETLLEAVSAARRARLHGRVAEALERGDEANADAAAAQLAAHFYESASVNREHASRALHYFQVAARVARSQYAWDAAARQYEHALALVAASPGGHGADEGMLLTEAAWCHQHAGDLARARELLVRAIALYRQRGDGIGLAAATLAALPNSDWYEVEELRRPALELLGDRDVHLRARLLVPLALGPMSFAIPPDMARIERAEAAALAARHGFDDVTARLRDEEAHDEIIALRFEAALPAIAVAEQAFHAIGDFHRALHHRHDAVAVYAMQGETAETEARARRLLDEAEARGSGLYRAFAYGHLLRIALLRDDLPLARSLLERIADATHARFWTDAARGELALRAGDVTSAVGVARSSIEGAREGVLPRAFLPVALGLAARAASYLGDDEGALAYLDEWASLFESQPYVLPASAALAAVDGVLARVAGEPLVRAVYERAASWEPVRAAFVVPRALDHVRGQLALRLDLVDEAERHFRLGVEWSDRERWPIELGRSLLGLGAVAARGGRRRDARTCLDRAESLFAESGSPLDVDDVRAARALIATSATPGHAAGYPDGLSVREVEVLALLAAGKTNAQIAEALVIASATAARHVSNILNKTGLSNRTQAASYAVQHGLATVPLGE